MSDTAIRVENLSKKYILGHQQQEKYTALRDAIAKSAKGLAKSLSGKSEQTVIQEEFWALRDMSFDIQQGDRVGIIGRNGAGKSTLLKVLSRITEPTTGSIRINGRIASLLEVGTGFHPELTGRENIFLNGAILGMGKNEIQSKFDEIVDFAEVEKFLDTPVKRYSSGMYVRLAFAVAAHMEPEILIVDEVLAVGDSAFQKKCLGKMEDVGKDGRTVLFVSHNMSTIQKLCSTGIFLQSGKILFQGDAKEAIDLYLDATKQGIKSEDLRSRKDRQGTNRVKIVDFYAEDVDGHRQEILRSGEDYKFIMEYETASSDDRVNDVVGCIHLKDTKGESVLLVRSNFTNQNFTLDRPFGRVECEIKDFNLTSGTYISDLLLSHRDSEALDMILAATEVTVESGDFFGTGNPGMPSHCKVLTHANWSVS